MAIQVQLENGSLVAGGGAAFKAANVHLKPLDHGTLGQYRVVMALKMVANMAANARLFELRNTAANLIIPTRLTVSALPIGGIDAPYLFEVALYKYTSFTAVDTLNVTTPTAGVMRTSGMSAAPGGAALRHASVGVNSGMSSGTLTKDQQLARLQAWMATVSANSQPVTREWIGQPGMEHPPIFAQNEGFVIENVNVGPSVQNNVQVLIELAWAEVTAF